MIRLYDVSRAPASMRRDSTRAKNEHVSFSSYSRVVVVSWSNRNRDIGFSDTVVDRSGGNDESVKQSKTRVVLSCLH